MGKDLRITRRHMLQGLAAVTLTATNLGCSTSSDEEDDYILHPSQDITMDKSMQTMYSTGPFNCGSRCTHKIRVKNGRMMMMTSDGDIPRAGVDGVCAADLDEYAGIEFGKPLQERSCVRGYAYIQRSYQPDRLKYPMIQYGNKGDINGFKRVSWEKALSYASEKIAAAYARREELGYVPIMANRGFDYLDKAAEKISKGRHLFPISNESTGNQDSARFDALGLMAFSNCRNDRFNTDFLLVWGLDSSRATYWQPHSQWITTVLSEQGKEIVNITSTCTDMASVITKGATVSFVKYKGSGTEDAPERVDIPSWVPCRPATDGALAIAMCYVIYKRNLHNTPEIQAFLNEKCFGFFPEQQIVSTSGATKPIPGSGQPTGTMTSTYNMLVLPAEYEDPDGVKHPPYTTGFNGLKFKVPTGWSFEEYLKSLENPSDDATLPGWATSGAPITNDEELYYAVLGYASRLTGVSVEIIEALAIKYARPLATKQNDGYWGHSALECGGGPQRAFNGAEWSWATMSLSALCGHIDKKGGGFGSTMYSQPEDYLLGVLPGTVGTYCFRDPMRTTCIPVPLTGFANFIITGKDYRSYGRIIKDTVHATLSKPNEIVLLTDKLPDPNNPTKMPKMIEMDVFMAMGQGTGSGSNPAATVANINKTIKALEKVFVIVADQVMNTTAQYADVILPADDFLEVPFISGMGQTTTIHGAQRVAPRRYDTLSDAEIIYQLSKAVEDRTNFGVELKPAVNMPMADEAVLEGTYKVNKPRDFYKQHINPDYELPSYEDFKTKYNFKLPHIIPPEKALVGLNSGVPELPSIGNLENSTGRFNFFSPFWWLRPGEFVDTDPNQPVEVYPKAFDIKKYVSGWRTPTSKYIPNREGYEFFFEDKDLKKFTGYKSPISKRTYPLLYMTNKARNRAHTNLDNVAVLKDQFKQCVKMNPKDAGERGINEGDLVYVYNDRGCMKIPANLTHTVLPGVISVEHGAWYRPHPSETATVWLDTAIMPGMFASQKVPVDIGGAENLLTDDNFSLDPVFLAQALTAQGGPCQVSLTHPDGQ